MSAEEWRPIAGYPGYAVSDQGRIRVTKLGQSRIIPGTPFRGYIVVNIKAEDGVWRVRRVHQFVAETFIGPRPEGYEVRHLDGNGTHNALSNLQYGTSSENTLDLVRHGRHNYARRTACKHGHPYTPENTGMREIKGRPFRVCLTCQRGGRPKAAA